MSACTSAIEYVVTQHALERWRERVALYANEGVADVLKAVREARFVATNELPFPARTGFHYLLHEAREIYFVAERLDACRYRLVTVRTSRDRETAALPVTNQRLQQEPTPEQHFPDLEPEPPSFADKLAERAWLVARLDFYRVQCRELDPDSSARRCAGLQTLQLCKRLGELRPYYDAWKLQQKAIAEEAYFLELFAKAI